MKCRRKAVAQPWLNPQASAIKSYEARLLNRRMSSKVSGDFVTQTAELCANLAGAG